LLHEKGILEYAPEQSASALLFTQPRPGAKALKFPAKFIDAWVKSKEERTEGMLTFLESESCLFQEIEMYFGQVKGAPCGTCSNCTRNHYPDQTQVERMQKEGAKLDDIWFDLNCSPDELKS
jgi:superfamily II DNA helicase RecQ